MNQEICSSIDAMLCHGTLFLFGLAFAAIVIWLLSKKGKIDVILEHFYRLTPLIIVFFSIWFFYHAFEVTHSCSTVSNDLQLPQLNQLGVDTNLNYQIIAKVDFLARQVQEKVANISSVEHDRFRAELGTWLSIFGLLSIIATIVVPVATYKVQYGTLEKKMKKLIDQYDKQKEKAEEIQSQIDSQEARSSESIAFMETTTSTDGKSYVELLNQCRIRKAELFKIGIGSFKHKEVSQKAEQTVGMLKEINEEVLCKTSNLDVLKLALNIINSVNMFLGTKTAQDSGFTQSFMEELVAKKPLSVQPADMDKRLRGLPKNLVSIYRGFYNTLFSKQVM